MRASTFCFVALVAVMLALLSSPSAAQSTYQWGYVLRCAPSTLDYPCLITVTGTATVSSTLQYANTSDTINGTKTAFTNVPYYNIQAFTGTRTFTNRFQQTYSYPIVLTSTAPRATGTNLYLNAPYLNSQGFAFVNNATVQFYGGLLATEFYISLNPFASEGIYYLGQTNALNNDFTQTIVCSTAPNFVAAPYNGVDDVPAAYNTMTQCTNAPAPNGGVVATVSLPPVGSPAGYNLTYTITDNATFSVSVAATLITDGTVNYDQIGNPYFNLIQMTGSRAYTYLVTGATTSTAITSLMAQNILASSNLAYITNNNRLYTQYPFFDRYGVGYTLASGVAVDGAATGNQVIQSVYVYRENTVEQSLSGDAYPATNFNNVLTPLNVVPITLPSTYQLVQWCYSMQGLPNTVDYPWLVATSGTALISNVAKTGNITTGNPQQYYQMLGFVGNRNYTNKYGVSYVNSVTLDPLGEDKAVNALYLASPYAGSIAFHLNGTIETPGGLPATDISVYLNPYPIEGTAYYYGVGNGTNALNNDPSKTVFASNAVNFATGNYANVFPYNTSGTVFGTTNFASCVNPSSFRPIANTPPPSGVQVFLFQYGFVSTSYSVNASIVIVTDGTLNTDALGNYYYNAAALNGTHMYTFNNVTYTTAITALLPICSGPSVSNLDNVYCNDNRIFNQYPFIDRLGLAFEYAAAQPSDNSSVASTRYGGVYIYRHTVLEEAAPVAYPNFSDAPPQYVALSTVTGTTYQAVQWGYRLKCANNTLDYPCTVSVIGTAIIASANSNTVTTKCTTYNCGNPYLQVVGFVGTRTFYTKYGGVLVQNVSLAQLGEEYGDGYLYLQTPYVDTDGLTFYLNGTDGATTEFQGGLVGNEVNIAVYPFVTENIAISAGAGNTLYYDPSATVICSTAPGFVPNTYSPNLPNSPSGNSSMAGCLGAKINGSPNVNNTGLGLRSYNLQYTVTDGVTYSSSVNANLFTDGTVNQDSIGNIYYNVISANGLRTYTYLPTGAVTIQNITSLMAQNIVPTSNLGYITNNNRLYPTYPFLDRYGVAFELNTTISPDGVAVGNTNPFTPTTSPTTDIIAVLVYRDNTLEEYTVFGGGAYPPTNVNNTLLPITLTKTVPPPTYQLVQWCYVLYSLNNTIDAPWAVSVTGTALIDNSTGQVTNGSYGIVNTPYYNTLGFVGTRNFTNRYGVSFVNTVTLNSFGEVYNTNQLWLTSPYAGGLSFHLNGTIQMPGGLPATDIEVFLDPYPVESSGFGYGTGSGVNTVNNDPSLTVFASNAPGFTPSTYSNVPISQIGSSSVGTVYGTNDLTQCVARFTSSTVGPIQKNVAPAAGVRVFNFQYTITNTKSYVINANYQITTDGVVYVDGLGQYYFNAAALSGTRTYLYIPTGVTSVANITALLPICSGPSVSNLDSVYCNDNRIYQQYPFLTRDGLAYEFGSTVANAGLTTGGTAYGGVYVYRATALEEARSSAYPTWSDNVNQTVTLTPVASTNFAVQWGYKMMCANNTIDYPCTVTVIGTAILNTNVSSQFTTGCTYHACNVPYYQMLGFVGVRTFYNRYGKVFTQNVSLSQVGEDYADQILYTAAPYLDGDGVTFYLNGTDGALTQFPGGLMGNEVNIFLDPYATESLAVSGGPSNALFYDPAATIFCSTAPGFQTNTYSSSSPANAAGSTSMAACVGSKYGQTYTALITAPGLRAYNFGYTVSTSVWSATVASTLFTDGTVNYDSLGNVYYNVIAINGSRSYTYTNSTGSSSTSVVQITSLMAQNIVQSSNRPDITNNNRLYPYYPFLDSYGLAFTTSANIAPDNQATGTTDIVSAYVYRENTLEETTLNGGGYPATNTANNVLPITLTKVAPPPTYQLVQWCYVLYGLPQTLDYPWSVVTSGTALIDNSTQLQSNATYGYSIGLIPYYPMLGFIGTRQFTNRYGNKFNNTVTLNPIGEDKAQNQLWLKSPYAGGIAFHVNGTIQTPGGLPATDISVFLDPYPIEGTAYNYGVGTGTNALNNDPSRTVFATNAPGFLTSTYSNVPLTQLNSSNVGNVYGTTDLTQCVAMPMNVTANKGPAAGVRVYSFNYQLAGASGNFTSTGNFTLITDGSVNVDQLGNYYFNVAAISGTRTYSWFPTNTNYVYNISALSPICSGPSVSNLDNVYCNNNRLYPQYPFIDRLGLAFQTSTGAPRVGAAPGTTPTLYQGVYVYREDVIEEANPASGGYPNWSDNPQQFISLTQLTATATANNYSSYQWGYLMICAAGSLDYPCAVFVNATVIVQTASAFTVSSAQGSCTYLGCGLPAYTVVGMIGTRTYKNRFNQLYVSNISLAANGEDYNDDLIYLQAPYNDGNGLTFRLNGTDGALTQMPGGVFGNEINVYLDPYPVETISTSGGGANALQTDPTQTVFCSTLPGFVPSAFNASNNYAAGSNVLASCALPTFSYKAPSTNFAATFSLSYNISDGVNYIALVSLTATPNGVQNVDALGNTYYNISYITGSRVYIDLATGIYNVSAITGLGQQTNYSTGGSQYNDNRIYTKAPYFDREGLTLTVSPNTPTAGTHAYSAVHNSSYFTIYNYRENLIEENPANKAPLLALQYISLVSGAVPPINLTQYGGVTNATIPIYTPSISSSSSSSTGGGIGRVTAATSTAGASTAGTSTGGVIAPHTSSSSSTGSIGGGGGATNGTSNSGGGGSGLSGGQIAGIVIGSVVGALLLCGICIFIVLSSRNTKSQAKPGDSESSKVQGASVIAPSEVSRTTGTAPVGELGTVEAVEMQPVHISEAQEV